jgi:hypothetical protein
MNTRILAAITLGIALTLTARAQTTNSWTGGNDKWESTNNWSGLVAPSTTDSADLITNAGNNTVTIDNATPSANLTINNLTLNANTLQLTNPGTNSTLHILNQLTLNTGATFINLGGTLLVTGPAQVN